MILPQTVGKAPLGIINPPIARAGAMIIAEKKTIGSLPGDNTPDLRSNMGSIFVDNQQNQQHTSFMDKHN
jgi:hypothetical protein